MNVMFKIILLKKTLDKHIWIIFLEQIFYSQWGHSKDSYIINLICTKWNKKQRYFKI
jgi:hypothetical protein